MSLKTNNACLTAESSSETLYQQLQQLVQQIIVPETESLIPTLITRLEERLKGENDKDFGNWIDFKNRLNDSDKAIVERFITALTQDHVEHSASDQGAITLELMDNDDLDKKLLWLSAVNLFEDSENAQRICHIKSYLGSCYPDRTLPATPEQLCESFFTAIAPLSPDRNIVQQLFIWFADHFKPVAGELWRKTDQLLSNRQSNPEPVNKTSIRTADIDPAPSSTRLEQEQPAIPHHETINTEFMDNLATQLVSRVDDLLTEDETREKEQNGTVEAPDLLEILSTLQMQASDQDLSPARLHDAIINSLTVKGTGTKLSRQHEDRINAIGWLFHHMQEDENLPDEIAKSIALLHIPVLKQAIVDESFLANYQHPARGLLTAFTSSAKYCQDASLRDHVSMLIEHTVRAVIGNNDRRHDVFQDCLEGFQSSLKEMLPMLDVTEDVLPAASATSVTDEERESDRDEQQTSATTQDTSGLAEEIILVSDTPASSSETEEKLTDSEAVEKSLQPLQQQAGTPAKILHCGQWVEFIGQGDSRRLRCKLIRVSEDGQRYIFVNRSGMTVAQRSATELQKGIENGSVHILDDNPIIDRAIQAVLRHFKKQ